VRIATGIVTNRSITRTDMSPMRTILIAMSNKLVVLAVAAAALQRTGVPLEAGRVIVRVRYN